MKIHGCKGKLEGGDQDHRREEAVWELFTSECVYFLDQLMVLKQVTLLDSCGLLEFSGQTEKEEQHYPDVLCLAGVPGLTGQFTGE